MLYVNGCVLHGFVGCFKITQSEGTAMDHDSFLLSAVSAKGLPVSSVPWHEFMP